MTSTKYIHNWGIRITAIIALVFLISGTVSQTGFSYDDYDELESEMQTKAYHIDVNVNENNSYDVTEKIQLDFLTEKHGLIREIPNEGALITNVSVPGETYTEDTSPLVHIIKIGDEDQTLRGEKEYTIRYRINMYEDENKSQDMFIFNVIPADWETPIENASGVIRLPKEADLSKAKVFSGEIDSDTNEDGVELSVRDGNVIEFNAGSLPYQHGITIMLPLPEGYWVDPPLYAKVKPIFWLLLALCPLSAVAAYYFFFKRHQEKPKRTVEFYPPEGLTPGEIAEIYGRSSYNILLSNIVYLANKGYLTIREDEDNNFTFTKKLEPTREPEYLQTLWNGIFSSGKDEVSNIHLGTKFHIYLDNALYQLEKSKKKKYSSMLFPNTPVRVACGIAVLLPTLIFRLWWMPWSYYDSGITVMYVGLTWCILLLSYVIAIKNIDLVDIDGEQIAGIIIASSIFLGGHIFSSLGIIGVFGLSNIPARVTAMMVAVLICSFIPYYFAIVARGHLASYTKMMSRIEGFKHFISTAELDKLETLVEDNPEYFYNILPYAYVFKLTDTWIGHFVNMELPYPFWSLSDTNSDDQNRVVSWADKEKRLAMKQLLDGCTRGVYKNLEYSKEELARRKSSGYRSGSSNHSGRNSGGSGWSGGGGFSGGGHVGGGAGGGSGRSW